MAQQQGQFDIEPVFGERPAAALLGALHPILHRVEVQVQLTSGGLVTRAGAQKDPQRLP